ncbi:FtsX-like permease family protein [Bryobacter aggregatus]|uniref:FtsX-like permease family protein n=1 Tax=Bryobacter aggregatus TaxID=360054 RepID=UPI0004E1AAFA|nr:ABC transporter permease [Bryobacter aggregatus]
MMRLVQRLILRPLWAERGRSSVTLISIALGVAVIFAMDLASEAAAGSFRSSMDVVSGPDDIEILATGGLPVELLGDLSQLPLPLQFAPRIEDFAIVNGKRSVPLLGVDVFANALQMDGDPPVSDLKSHGIFVSPSLGKRGDRIQLQINDKPLEYTVAAVIDAKQLSGDLIVMDIEDAEAVTSRIGRIDRILVSLPAQEKENVDAWVERLRPYLPPGATIRPIGARTEENRKMLSAFRWNLRVLSYIALMVGAFLIYNTISVSVVRRRAEIGIVRAVGGTQRLMIVAFLIEAVFFGVVGGVIGLVLGRFLAEGAVRLVGLTVQALYVSSTASAIRFDFASAAVALGSGLAVSLLAALAPAIEAGQVPPTDAMARGRIDTQLQEASTQHLFLALVLAFAALLLSQLPPVAGKPFGGYLATLALVASASLCAPSLIEYAGRCLARFGGVESLLAGRSLAGALRRSSVLVAALASAIAMMTSVGIMVGSFRETMLTWIDRQVQADFYLRPAGQSAMDRHPTISEDIAREIEALPGVLAVDRFRAYAIRYNGLPVTLAAGDAQAQMRYGRTALQSGDTQDALLGMQAGEAVIVSEPFSEKHHVKVGDRLSLPIGTARPSFRVAGIYRDYSSENGYIILDQSVLRKYLPNEEASNLAVYVAPDADRKQLRAAIEAAYAPRRIVVFENSALRREAVRIFDQTFAVTYALEAVAIFIAVMGVAGAMLALIIDRRREIGLLRFLGADKTQVRKMILFEAGYIGLFSQILGVVSGGLLSLVLIFVINKQSFGWTIEFHLPVASLLSALAFVFVGTIVAGLYPARVATRLNPIEVMHEQ